ncbi:MAG TPA: energy transducer TonB [Methylovirgula sp.]|nr:energy transducer TonB [Methylovirgula sp.]
MSAYTHTILPQRHARGVPRWVVAALIVVALHVGIGLFFILTRKPDLPAGAPTNTVMIDLAPVATSAAPPQEQAAPPTPQDTLQPEPTPPTDQPPPPPEPTLQTPPETTPVTPPEPTPPAPSELQTQELPVVPNAEAILPPPPKPTVDEKKIEEQKQQQQKIEKQKEIQREKLREEKAEKAAKAKQAAKARAAAQASRASREGGPAPGASRMSISAWQSIVQARVNGAASSLHGSGEGGSVSIAFTVTASGGVGGARVVGSSGNPTMDRMALSIAHRLGRLPPPPNGTITVRVPVHFH